MGMLSYLKRTLFLKRTHRLPESGSMQGRIAHLKSIECYIFNAATPPEDEMRALQHD